MSSIAQTERTCTRCGYPMVPQHRGPRPAGVLVHYARELCSGCYTAVRDAGELADYPRLTRPSSQTKDAYQSLRVLGASREQAARVLRMTEGALRRAVLRG